MSDLRGDITGDETQPTRHVLGGSIMTTDINPIANHAIDCYTCVDGPVTDAIIFPSVDALKSTPQWAFVKTTALLKLSDQSIWMLSCRSRTWTPIEVKHVGGKLLARDHSCSDGLSLRQKVKQQCDIQDRVLWDNLSMRTISQQWGVRDFVNSLHSDTDSANAETNRIETENALLRMLTDQITSFVAKLDPVIQPSALSSGSLNIWIYNYFIDQHHGRQRRQFGMTFPLLVSTVACPTECDKFDDALCRLVDGSAPLVKQLSAMWGVAPRVIRQLVGLSAALVGNEWHGNVRRLAAILDHLPPEALPNGTEQWIAFNKAVDIAEHWAPKSWQSSLIFSSILRNGIRAWKTEDTELAPCFDNAPFLRDDINRLLLCLELWLKSEIRMLRPHAEIRPETLTMIATSTLEALLRKGKLLTVARQFSRQSYSLIANQSVEVKLLYGIAIPPLLPYEFVSPRHDRRIRSLTTLHEFREHGYALNTCLGMSPQYFDECRFARTIILAIYESSSGKPLSTAKIALDRVDNFDRWEIELVMHTGYENSPVDQACAHAIVELVEHCKNPLVQREIGQGQKLLTAIRNDRNVWAQLCVEYPGLLSTVKKALGRSICQTAIERALSLNVSNGDIRIPVSTKPKNISRVIMQNTTIESAVSESLTKFDGGMSQREFAIWVMLALSLIATGMATLDYANTKVHESNVLSLKPYFVGIASAVLAWIAVTIWQKLPLWYHAPLWVCASVASASSLLLAYPFRSEEFDSWQLGLIPIFCLGSLLNSDVHMRPRTRVASSMLCFLILTAWSVSFIFFVSWPAGLFGLGFLCLTTKHTTLRSATLQTLGASIVLLIVIFGSFPWQRMMFARWFGFGEMPWQFMMEMVDESLYNTSGNPVPLLYANAEYLLTSFVEWAGWLPGTLVAMLSIGLLITATVVLAKIKDQWQSVFGLALAVYLLPIALVSVATNLNLSNLRPGMHLPFFSWDIPNMVYVGLLIGVLYSTRSYTK